MKSYKVVGAQPVEDSKGASHNPGEEFSSDYDVATEEFLVGIGALAVVSGKKDGGSNKREKDIRDKSA